MKTNITIISLIALGASLTGVLGSCATEAPFAGEGDGAVKMHVVLNDKLSRADGNADMALPKTARFTLLPAKVTAMCFINGPVLIIFRQASR